MSDREGLPLVFDSHSTATEIRGRLIWRTHERDDERRIRSAQVFEKGKGWQEICWVDCFWTQTNEYDADTMRVIDEDFGYKNVIWEKEYKMIDSGFDTATEIRARLVWREDPNHENVMTDGLIPEDGETNDDLLERELDLANQEGLWIRAVEFFDPKSQTWHEVLSWDGFIGQDCQADEDLMAEVTDSMIYQKIVWEHLSSLA